MNQKCFRILAAMAICALAAFSAHAAGYDLAGLINQHATEMSAIALVGSVSLPNGTTFFIASGYSASVPITAVSNASTAIATAANTLASGDIVEVTSGWARLTQKAVRVPSTGLTSSAFGLEGQDTTSTTVYPALGGTGSFRKVTGFTQLTQVLSSTSTGGEQQFKEYQFLEDSAKKRIPTSKSARGISFSIADDPTLAGYILAATADTDRQPRIVKAVLPNGSIILYNAYVTLNTTPTMTIDDIMACEVTLSLLADPVRYAS